MRLEEYNQGILDRANTRKVVTVTKKEIIVTVKTTKKAKPSRIVILRVGSTILASLGSKEQVVIKEPEEKVRVVGQ